MAVYRIATNYTKPSACSMLQAGSRLQTLRRKTLKIQGYDTYYRPVLYAFYPRSPLFLFPSLLPFSLPPFVPLSLSSVSGVRMTYGPGALPWARFGRWVPGGPFMLCVSASLFLWLRAFFASMVASSYFWFFVS